MSTPIDRAAEALVGAYLDDVKGDEDHHDERASTGALAALAAALDRDEIAQVLQNHEKASGHRDTRQHCVCEWVSPSSFKGWHRMHQADAVIAHLLGGAS